MEIKVLSFFLTPVLNKFNILNIMKTGTENKNKSGEKEMKRFVNVSIKNVVECTAGIDSVNELMKQYRDCDGAVITPAGKYKTLGGCHCVYGFENKNGKWFSIVNNRMYRGTEHMTKTDMINRAGMVLRKAATPEAVTTLTQKLTNVSVEEVRATLMDLRAGVVADETENKTTTKGETQMNKTTTPVTHKYMNKTVSVFDTGNTTTPVTQLPSETRGRNPDSVIAPVPLKDEAHARIVCRCVVCGIGYTVGTGEAQACPKGCDTLEQLGAAYNAAALARQIEEDKMQGMIRAAEQKARNEVYKLIGDTLQVLRNREAETKAAFLALQNKKQVAKAEAALAFPEGTVMTEYRARETFEAGIDCRKRVWKNIPTGRTARLEVFRAGDVIPKTNRWWLSVGDVVLRMMLKDGKPGKIVERAILTQGQWAAAGLTPEQTAEFVKGFNNNK